MKPEEILNVAVEKLMNFIYCDPNKVTGDTRIPSYLRIASICLDNGIYGYTIDNYITNIIDDMINKNEVDPDVDTEELREKALEFCEALRDYYIKRLDNLISTYAPNGKTYNETKSYLNLIKSLRPRSASEILSLFGAVGLKGDIIDLFNKKPYYDVLPIYKNNRVDGINFVIR